MTQIYNEVKGRRVLGVTHYELKVCWILRSSICVSFTRFFLLYLIFIYNDNNGRNFQLFNVAGYLIEESRRWPIITASPRGQCSK